MCFSVFLPVVLSLATTFIRKLVILEKVKDNFNYISCSLVDLSINILSCSDTIDLVQYQPIA
jgi:hypothetical protein